MNTPTATRRAPLPTTVPELLELGAVRVLDGWTRHTYRETTQAGEKVCIIGSLMLGLNDSAHWQGLDDFGPRHDLYCLQSEAERWLQDYVRDMTAADHPDGWLDRGAANWNDSVAKSAQEVAEVLLDAADQYRDMEAQ